MKKIINLTTKPNTSLNNRTGSWRTYRPLINYSTCISCGLCAKICPEGCVAMESSSQKKKPEPKINYDYCKGCGLCAQECPVKTIKMEKDYE